VQRGDTADKCLDFSEEVLRALLEAGADAIMVQSRDGEGTPNHHYVLAQVGEGAEQRTVMVDPTVNQFYPKYKQIYVGTPEALRERVVHSGKDQKVFNEFWPSKSNLYIPDGLYEELGQPSPKLEDAASFQAKWGAMGVTQHERFSSPEFVPSGKGRKR